MRIAIATLGCKTNSYESASLASRFPDSTEVVDFDQDADIYVINTCTVTGRTDFKSRNLIRKALAKKAKNPGVRIVVTGCYAQRFPDEIAALGEIDLIVDNQNKSRIWEFLQGARHDFQDASLAEGFCYAPVTKMLERSRAFQKIQDGCGLFCAYCAVSHARGPSRSASVEDVWQQARLFIENGYREIVLGGVNLGLYRDRDSGLAGLIRKLRELKGLQLLRLSSLEPHLVDESLLQELGRGGIICPHFHLSLQSGSDSILKAMGRRYLSSDFSRLIDRIKELIPDAAIGADLITGFPGETDELFAQTLDFVSSLPLTYLHVFSFSSRPDTKAAGLPNQVPNKTKKERTEVLTRLSDTKTADYISFLLKNQIPLRGVVESITDGIATLLSDHYIRCYTSDPVKTGEVVSLIPEMVYKDGLQSRKTTHILSPKNL